MASKRIARWLDPQTIAFVFLMKALLLLFGVIAVLVLKDETVSFPYGWLDLWNRWDALNYIDIARDGYVTTDVSSENQRHWIVFYPLFPWAIRAVAAVLRDYVVSAHVVSLAAALATAVMFQRLVELDYDRTIARSAVVFMFVFPTAYFFHAGYTESLFTAMALACVLAARTRRWGMAAGAGALASMTRANGLLLIPVLVAEAYLQYRDEGRRLQRAWLWIPAAGLGFLVYLFINDHVWNDPFYFRKVLSQMWGKQLSWPWTGVAKTLEFMRTHTPSRAHLFGTQELLFAALGLIFTVWCWRRLRLTYSVWMTLNLVLITSTTVFMSTPRYLLALFPIYILFALLAAARPFWGTVLTIWSVAFLALFACLFVVGQWAF